MKLTEIESNLKNEYLKAKSGLNLISQIRGESQDDPHVLDIPNGTQLFSLISSYSAQTKAPLAEKFIAKKLHYNMVSASQGQGDFYDPVKGEYIELKVSFSNKGKNLNIRQIRPWQDVESYLLLYIDDFYQKDNVLFRLNKVQMLEEIKNHGSHTHGTHEANKLNRNHEFSITIPIDPKKALYNRWSSSYRDDELLNKIMG